MNKWREVFLDEVADEVTVGFVGSMTQEYIERGIPFFRSKNVVPYGLNFNDIKYISREFHEKISKSQLAPGDVVIVRTGTPGTAAMVPDSVTEANCSDLVIVRPGPELDNRFLVYYLNTSAAHHVHANLVGAVQQHFNVGAAKKLYFALPPLPEQRAIAGVLSSLDDKIDLLHRQNKTLEALAETLFRQWFVEEANDDWETTTFAEHVDAFRGLSYKGSGLTELGLGLPMHNLNSVFEGGGYKEAGIKYYSGDYQQRHIVHSGDVIVTNTEQGHEFRLIGFPANVPRHFGDTGIFSQHIYRVVPKEVSYLTRDFLYYLIMERDVREQIISATNGSTVNMLAIDGLQRPTFRLPPKSRVQEFTRFATESRQKRELNHDAVRTLEKLRDTLLPKLMSGEVRVEYE